jgi:hypothetical protein
VTFDPVGVLPSIGHGCVGARPLAPEGRREDQFGKGVGRTAQKQSVEEFFLGVAPTSKAASEQGLTELGESVILHGCDSFSGECWNHYQFLSQGDRAQPAGSPFY